MRRFSLSVLVVLLCTRFPFVKPGISSLKLLPLVLASSFFSGNLLASRAEPVYKGSGNALTIAAESQITYGFYVFSKTSDGSSGLSRVFLCLDDGTITLRCNVFDKSRVTLKSFPLFLEKTLKVPSFTLEKETCRVLPYGEVWFSEGSEDFAPKYNSQELDKESQFYYFNARHYDPELARFVTADVVIDGEDTAFGWNRYMYVHGNPIMYKDPTGHAIFTAIAAGAVRAVAACVKSTACRGAVKEGAKQVVKFSKKVFSKKKAIPGTRKQVAKFLKNKANKKQIKNKFGKIGANTGRKKKIETIRFKN